MSHTLSAADLARIEVEADDITQARARIVIAQLIARIRELEAGTQPLQWSNPAQLQLELTTGVVHQ